MHLPWQKPNDVRRNGNGRNGKHHDEQPCNGHAEWLWTGNRFVTAHKNPRGRYVDQRNVSINFWLADDGEVYMTLRVPKGVRNLVDLNIQVEVTHVHDLGRRGCEVRQVQIPFDGQEITYNLRQRDRVILPAD